MALRFFSTFLLINSAIAGTLFDLSHDMCCDGTVRPRSSIGHDSGVMCCGNVTFDPSHELCCANRTVALPMTQVAHYDCCGHDALYDLDTEMCCDGRVFKRFPESANGTVSAGFPGSGDWRGSFLSCCGNDVYNFTMHDCCEGQLLTRTSPSQSCCGPVLIDNAHQLCCYDFANGGTKPRILQRDGPDIGCCGGSTIDFRSQACCADKPVDLPKEEDLRLTSFCCGEQLWKSAPDEACCDGAVLKRRSATETCCGTVLYDYATHLCCGNTVFPRTSNATFCCGNQPYNDSAEVCCFNTGAILALENPLQNFCCD